MALTKMVNACRLLGRKKIFHVIIFWFVEDVIYLSNYFKNIPKHTKEKEWHKQRNKFTTSIMLWNTYFGSATGCLDKKTEYPTDIFEWKLFKKADNSVTKLIQRSIENNKIKG